MDKFVNARYARFTNSNPKLRLRLSLDWDFSDSFAPLIHQKNLVHFFSVFCYTGQKLILQLKSAQQCSGGATKELK